MDKVGEQLPAVGTALAGLILVFLGVICASWEGFSAEQQGYVRRKYHFKTRVALAGMLASLASVVFGLIGIETQHHRPGWDRWGCIMLAVAGLLTILIAWLTIREI